LISSATSPATARGREASSGPRARSIRILSTLLAVASWGYGGAGAAGPASDSPLPRYGVFVFSDVCREPQSGDTAGEFVTLTRIPAGDDLSVSLTDGALMEAQQARHVTIDNSGRISADIPDNEAYHAGGDPRAHIRGQLTSAALVLDPVDGAAPERLARVRDFGAVGGSTCVAAPPRRRPTPPDR